MMGSTLDIRQTRYPGPLLPDHVRYATTIESLRSIASSATALVRSTVRRTEFICRRNGSKGDSSSTRTDLAETLLARQRRIAHVQCCRSSCPQESLGSCGNQSFSSYASRVGRGTYSLRMALTTAFEKGAVDREELILKVRLSTVENIKEKKLEPWYI